MKLVIATPLYPPDPGGPATYTKLLEDHLPEQGDTVELVKFGDVRHLPPVIRHIAYFFAVRKKARRADLVLVLDPVSTGLPASLAALSLGKRYVVKVVGDYAWEQGTQRFGVTDTLDEFVHRVRVPFRVQLFRYIQTFVAHNAVRVLVPSAYLKGIVEAWGISPEKIHVIYNSIELPHIAHVSVPSGKLIVFVGRLVPWKKLPELIEAVSILREGVPDAKLVIVGDGPERDALVQKGTQLLGDAFIYTGSLKNEEALAYTQHARVFALNSSYEGLSHVLIETLCLGVPCVTTDAGGNTELIQNEMNGLVVPVGDTQGFSNALLRILRDDDLRDRLHTGALQTASRFSVSTMTTDTHNFLHSLI